MHDYEMTAALLMAQRVAEGNYDAEILLACMNADVEKSRQITTYLKSVCYKYDYVKLALDKLYLETVYQKELEVKNA